MPALPLPKFLGVKLGFARGCNKAHEHPVQVAQNYKNNK